MPTYEEMLNNLRQKNVEIQSTESFALPIEEKPKTFWQKMLERGRYNPEEEVGLPSKEKVAKFGEEYTPMGALGKGLGLTAFKYLTPEGRRLEKGLKKGTLGEEELKAYSEIYEKAPTAKQTIGSAAGTALLLATPTIGKGLGYLKGATGLTQTISKLPSLVQRLTNIGIAGLETGAISASFGALKGMEEDLTTPEINKKAIQYGITGAIIGAGIQLGAETIDAAATWLHKIGQKIQYSVIKPNQADIKDGFNIKNVEKYKLGGTLREVVQKGEQQLDDLNSQLKTKLTENEININLNDVYSKTEQSLIQGKKFTFGMNKPIQNALTNLSDEISTISENPENIDLVAANTIKRASGRVGAWEFGKPDIDASAREKVYTAFYHQMKIVIEQAMKDPAVKQLNKQMQDLIPIVNAATRRLPIALRNQPIGLLEGIGLLGTVFNPRSWILVAAQLATKSGKVGAMLTGIKPPGVITPEKVAGTTSIIQRLLRK